MMVIKLKKVQYGNICALLIFFQYLIVLGIAYVLNQFGLKGSDYSSYIYYFFFIIFFALFVFNKGINSRIGLTFWIFYLFVLLALISGLLKSPTSFELDKTGFSYLQFLLFFPSIVLLFMLNDDYDSIVKYLVFGARILSILCILILYTANIRGDEIGVHGYDMVLGYQLALCSIVLFLSVFRKRNIYDLIMAFICFILCVLYGSRGASFVVLTYLVVMLFKKNYLQAKAGKKIIFIILAVTLVVVISFYFEIIMSGIIIHLKAVGIESRTLEKLLEGTISDDNGRDILQKTVISSWNNMPILGYGLLGDRQFINGTYVHNLVIELFTDYGFFVGGILLLALVVYTIKCLCDRRMSDFLIIVAVYSLVGLMFSGSYITNIHFYILVALFLRKASKSKIAGERKNESIMAC